MLDAGWLLPHGCKDVEGGCKDVEGDTGPGIAKLCFFEGLGVRRRICCSSESKVRQYRYICSSMT